MNEPLPEVHEMPDPELMMTPLDEVLRIEGEKIKRPVQQPTQFQVKGSGLQQPAVVCVCEDKGATIMVGDERSEAYSFEVFIPSDTLVEMLERVAEHHPKYPAAVLSLMHSVKWTLRMR